MQTHTDASMILSSMKKRDFNETIYSLDNFLYQNANTILNKSKKRKKKRDLEKGSISSCVANSISFSASFVNL